MATKPINELDFATIKDQFITHLRNQTQFKDYDFTGANMNVLLDVLAYNTHINNFYTNMAINEMFLDSAVIKNSVVSHAKELNYLPRSRKSAKAVVNVTLRDTTEASSTITIPRFTEFTANFANDNYTFITDQSYVARKTADGVFVATNVEIFEGRILTAFEKDGFFLEADNTFKCNLTNDGIDTNTIEVFVDDEFTEGQNQFFYTRDIFGVTPTSKVFYLEPHFDNRYSIYFGGNIFGEQPGLDIDVKIQYRICSGTEVNGANAFATSFKPNSTVTTVTAAEGGSERESLESIRYFAPKSIQVQERAITASDYQIILSQRFPEIKSVSAYGGDELVPPRYGRVAISVNLQGEGLLSETSKNTYLRYLSDKTPLSIEPIFVNPEFLYSETIVDVIYSKKFTTKSTQELESLIRVAIASYNTLNLDDFGETLRVSKLMSIIDDIDAGILSNNVCANPIIEYAPIVNLNLSPSFKFGTQLVKPYPYDTTIGLSDFKPSITSSTFTYKGILSKMIDDGAGNIAIVSVNNLIQTITNPSVGTVDYTLGEVRLVNFSVESFVGEAIKIYAASMTPNIIAPKNRIISIRSEDIQIKFVESL
tara:strand:+ start:8263 stop:10047 length:1785 start_codon:yes stop_codon:yes gene_type:complete